MEQSIKNILVPKKTVKVTGYREQGVVSNETFWPFSSANMQDLLTTLKLLFSKGFIQVASCTRNAVSIPYTRTVSYSWLQFSIFHVSFLNLCKATRGNFLAIPSLQDCQGTDGTFLKILNCCRNIHSLLHKSLLACVLHSLVPRPLPPFTSGRGPGNIRDQNRCRKLHDVT